MSDDLGRLVRGAPGAQHELHFERVLAHPPGKVWRALTEPEHLAAWFPSEIRGVRRAGAPLQFVFGHDPDHPIDGELVVYDPPRRLEYRWGDERMCFSLEPDGDAGTRLSFVNTFDDYGKAARDAAGWHVCLGALSARLDGAAAAQDPALVWPEVQARYRDAFGAEAATIGPTAGTQG